MDASEKSLLLKLIETFTSSDKDVETESKQSVTPEYIKEPDEHVEKLRKRMEFFEAKTEVKAGDIVIWKDGLKNKRLPEYGQPAIVVKIIEPPIMDDDPTYSEEMDIQLGFVTEDDDFFVYNYDSRRFRVK